MLKHNYTRERYTGEFKDNNIEGWGEYYRVVKNKVLKAKGNRKACKGTEYILIWSNFLTIDADDLTASKNVDLENDLKYLRIERGAGEAFLAFPRGLGNKLDLPTKTTSSLPASARKETFRRTTMEIAKPEN